MQVVADILVACFAVTGQFEAYAGAVRSSGCGPLQAVQSRISSAIVQTWSGVRVGKVVYLFIGKRNRLLLRIYAYLCRFPGMRSDIIVYRGVAGVFWFGLCGITTQDCKKTKYET